MESLNSATPHAKGGRIRPLGVSGPKRSPALPEVPTIAEAGVPGYSATTWNGMVTPAGVPASIVVKLNTALNNTLRSPPIRQRFASLGAEPVGGSTEQFAALIRSEYKKWGEVIRRANARIE